MAAFQIPRTPHTTNKTIRFPDDVIADVEAAIAGKDCTFSAFVIAAVRSWPNRRRRERAQWESTETPHPNADGALMLSSRQ